MYESLLNFPGTLFADLDRLRREFDDAFDAGAMPSSIRSVAPGAFPALNVGNTANSVDIFAFAPGIDPAKVDLTIDRGVLTIAGERSAQEPGADAGVSVYSRERSSGRFLRAISLPDDIDPSKVQATYRDGVLHVSVERRQAAQPTRITVQ